MQGNNAATDLIDVISRHPDDTTSCAMAPDYKTFLATEVLSEQRIISYRIVSRALKVHVNAAKCMLYEFQQNENKKKPDSVAAVYLISGQKKKVVLGNTDKSQTTETNGTASDPDASQNGDNLPGRLRVAVKSIVLCREEDLEATKEEFQTIQSLHIHSITPGLRLGSLTAITDTSRVVFDDYHSTQDPLIHNKQYGIIQNPNVWRRTGKRPTNVDVPLAKVEAKVKAAAKDEKRKLFGRTESEKETTPAEDSRPTTADSNASKGVINKSKINLKREGSSLFKAFAKQSTKPELERKDTDTSAASDSKMSGMTDDDEGEDDDAMFLDTGTSTTKKRPNEAQKEREDRQAKLRKMMEDDDAEEPAIPSVANATDIDADPPAAKTGTDADGPEGDGDQVDWSESDSEKKKSTQKEPEGPKRRRGKRKVLKKRTAKDEDGYLVTKEEEVYESFSEDEPEVASKSAFPPVKSTGSVKSSSQKSSAPSSGTVGKKKDIMSFFGKK